MSITLIFLFLNCFLASLAIENKCTLVPKTSGNTKRDNLLRILENKGLYGKSFSYVDKDIEYKMKVCGNAGEIENGTILAIRESKDDSDVDAIGLRNMTDVIGDVEEGWIMLSFEAGPTKNMYYKCIDENATLISQVMVLCDEIEYDGNFKLLVRNKEVCRYTFELKTSLVCVQHGGMSGWSIFFLIIFLGFAAYFIAGVTYLRCVVGAKGIEQIPHKAVWFRIGNIIADGCEALCRCDRYCTGTAEEASSIRSTYSDYSPIGGTTSPNLVAPQTNEQDAALINP